MASTAPRTNAGPGELFQLDRRNCGWTALKGGARRSGEPTGRGSLRTLCANSRPATSDGEGHRLQMTVHYMEAARVLGLE